MMGAWIELFRSLGQALIDLAKAELATLRDELSHSGRTLAIALALFGAAAVVGFWLVGAAIYTLIQVLAIWLPLWGASLLVTGLFALVVAVLALVGAHKLKGIESPMDTAGRRWEDHLAWWNDRLLAETTALDEGTADDPKELR